MNGGSGYPGGYDVRKTWGSVRPGPDTCAVRERCVLIIEVWGKRVHNYLENYWYENCVVDGRER